MPSAPGPTILLVEDHALTRRFLADNLLADGYEPVEAGSLAAARRQIAATTPALAVLDMVLPDGDGLALLGELREPEAGLAPELPVIVLSGRAGELDRVRGLQRGADDFLAKPCSFLELRARIDAVLRRAARRPGTARVRIGSLEVDPLGRRVWVDGVSVTLSNKEFGLLQMLASEPTRVFTREELMREVWGYRSPGMSRTLDSHAHRLRRKLAHGRASYVVNVWGVGYRLTDLPLPA